MRLLFEIDKKDYDPDGKVFVRPSSRAIIIINGKIAVIYSQKHKYYKIPGGGIEPGESKIDAMIREVKEEVGLTVIPESITEFGYVHVSYITQKKEEFIPCFVDLDEAIRVKEKYVKENSYDSMIERELRVMRMIADTQKI